MSIHLETVPNHRIRSSIIAALFNEMGVKAFALTGKNTDTEFEYEIYTEQKITKPYMVELKAFIRGFIVAMNSL